MMMIPLQNAKILLLDRFPGKSELYAINLIISRFLISRLYFITLLAVLFQRPPFLGSKNRTPQMQQNAIEYPPRRTS
jgi:hypothetical protein